MKILEIVKSLMANKVLWLALIKNISDIIATYSKDCGARDITTATRAISDLKALEIELSK